MAPQNAPARPPVVPESFLSVPEQRLYILSIGALVQALKMLDLFSAMASTDVSWRRLLWKWIIIDAVYVWTMASLRIPRLAFTKRARIMYIFVFAAFNWVLFGSYTLSFVSLSPNSIFRWTERQLALSERRVSVEDVINAGSHLRGQHTVRLSPISTATLNPFLQTFCLTAGAPVFIPVVFNNTRPRFVQYSHKPLEEGSTKTLIELSARDLQSIDQSIISIPPAPVDVDEDEAEALVDLGAPRLQKTEVLHHIKVSKPGVIHLERAGESNEVGIRLRMGSVTVVECPTAQFVDKVPDATRCTGGNEDLALAVFGVPPLALTWTRKIDARLEEFVVEGIEGKHFEKEKEAVVAEKIPIPLTISLEKLGSHIYTLESIRDRLGNAVSLGNLPVTDTIRTFAVLRRPEVSFSNCAAGKPVGLRKGQTATLRVKTHDADGRDAPWTVTLEGPKQSKQVLELQSSEKGFDVKEEGEWTIKSVKGRYCPGDILSPDTCRVAELPVPSAEASWEKLRECSGDTGVSAALVLHGTPPFTVTWLSSFGGQDSVHSRTVDGSRGAFMLQPERSGTYKYTYLKLSDANYKDIKLNGPSVELNVHPVASAQLRKGKRDEVYSCAGNNVDVEVDLKGSAPWKLEVQVLGPKGSRTIPFPGLHDARTKLNIAIPEDINSEGGTFQIDLVSVEDAHGCKRPLSEQGMSVKVKRVKPTVKFYGKDGKREVTVHQGEDARLPLRLTGDGPWKLEYHLKNKPGRKFTERIGANNANAELRVRDSGIFELLEISDKHCPGSIIEPESQYVVNWVPRPSVKLAETTAVTHIPTNDSYIRAPICEGLPDHVDLELTGRAPFKIKYLVAQERHSSPLRIVSADNTIGSIQRALRFALDTSTPGRMLYRVRDIGDAAYPLRLDNHIHDNDNRLQFEQQVLERPSAAFKNAERLSYCLGDALTPISPSYKEEGVIVLDGAPPFALDLAIRNLGTSDVQHETVYVPTNEWKLNVPRYILKSVGQHLVEIQAVRDANGCDHAPLDPTRRNVWIDVAETAAIVPYDRRLDYCVGDALQFQLEGTPPWRVQYDFNGRRVTASSKTSQFRRVAGAAGTFSVVSIAHQRNMCQTPVNDLHIRIHEIPSAEVSHGNKFLEDIREGEQAEIVFTLIGEPPFTFTYQRAELTKYKSKTPKVLETHTVTGIMTNEYSIFSALEGTWTVTFISDRWCRYPPAQTDSTVEKA
ncbi:hypothetical protein BKA62DRAFT_703554 [Auriculariales sp. MPI-PUGE-AT-0066]|nr:hypothetical protein BKA62DRAFT_703554 [Auriculariales sp. MPI-PUGE-AT-0066]